MNLRIIEPRVAQGGSAATEVRIGEGGTRSPLARRSHAKAASALPTISRSDQIVSRKAFAALDF